MNFLKRDIWQISKSQLNLQRVFHGIRFKVNKDWLS